MGGWNVTPPFLGWARGEPRREQGGRGMAGQRGGGASLGREKVINFFFFLIKIFIFSIIAYFSKLVKITLVVITTSEIV